MTARLELGPIDVRPDPQQRLVAIGGVVVAIGSILSVFFVAIGLYVTNEANRQTNEANREQQRLTAQGQITDRFTKAVEQLGQPGPEKVDVRLGSIYALERIMRDSAVDQPAVVDILAAFIRVHSPAPARATPGPTATRPPASRPRLPVDIQAAVTVLGRRDITRDVGDLHRWRIRPDLTDTNLAGADLAGADLTLADLTGADLTRANLYGANLTNAYLTRASLTGAGLIRADLILANLYGANLTGANLTGANLTNATLTGADLILADLLDANLTSADLAGTDLTGANLHGADLTSADLTGADLTRADLTCVRTNDRTRLPEGVPRPAPCG